jgi:hypothetical protein
LFYDKSRAPAGSGRFFSILLKNSGFPTIDESQSSPHLEARPRPVPRARCRSAFAQSTSAGVGGVVTDASGAPVSGAQVTITHVESGTVSHATTDASGRYNARGLRVGGPYTITVRSPASAPTPRKAFTST